MVQKMKNLVSMLMIAGLVSMMVFSCSKDDDKGNDEDNLLIGTWVSEFSGGYSGYTFNANGTGKSFEIDYDDDGKLHEDKFRYSYDNLVITVVYDELDDMESYKEELFIVSLTKDVLVLTDPDGYKDTYKRRD